MSSTTDPSFLTPAQEFAALAEICRCRTDVAADDISLELREILGRIGSEPELRFFVDGTRNFGHQVSTIVLVKRLIARAHYTGQVRIVYADYENPYLGR